MIEHAMAKEVIDDIPGDALQLWPEDGEDAWGMPNFWIIFKKPEERQEFLRKWQGKWIETSVMSAKLTYVLDWKDVNGWGLELTCWHR